MNLFGTSGALIGPIQLIFGGASFLLGAILRKQLNDWMNIKFSAFGSFGVGSLAFIIAGAFMSLKFAILLGLAGFVAGGILLSFLDGESSGGGEGEYSSEGNYEE